MDEHKIKLETEPEWIPFIGEIIDKEEEYQLVVPTGGTFLIKKEFVKTKNDKISIKIQSSISILSEPRPVTVSTLRDCNCSNTIPPTNREERIPKFGCETKCFGVVLVCYYCIYGPGGVLQGEESNVCGVCVGFPF